MSNVPSTTEFRNTATREVSTDPEVVDGWTESGYEVDERVGAFSAWTPSNYEAGFDYERDGYLDPERDREYQLAKSNARIRTYLDAPTLSAKDEAAALLRDSDWTRMANTNCIADILYGEGAAR